MSKKSLTTQVWHNSQPGQSPCNWRLCECWDGKHGSAESPPPARLQCQRRRSAEELAAPPDGRKTLCNHPYGNHTPQSGPKKPSGLSGLLKYEYIQHDRNVFKKCEIQHLPQHSPGFPDSLSQQVFPDSLFNQELVDLCPPRESSSIGLMQQNLLFNYSNTDGSM